MKSKPQKAWALTDRKSGKIEWVGLEKPKMVKSFGDEFPGLHPKVGSITYLDRDVIRISITPVKK